MPRRKKIKRDQVSFRHVALVLGAAALALFLVLSSGKNISQLAGIVPQRTGVVRPAAFAGSFYPADPKELDQKVGDLLAKVPAVAAKGEVLALIVPHAGYEFSGQVAAAAFKQLSNEQIDTVVLIGNSHYELFDGISVFPQGVFQTPLGRLEVDSDLARAVMAEDPRISFQKPAHEKEHSLEVELPFLQRTLQNFKILPILFGNKSHDDWPALAKALAKNIKGKNVLLVASSDLSHYPALKDAEEVDSETIKMILSGDTAKLEKAIQEMEKQKIPGIATFACGLDAIKVVLAVEKELGGSEIKLLNYSNSGRVTKDQSRVVGYAAIGFFGERRGSLLNQAEQKKLLDIDRQSVESFVKSGQIPEFKVDFPMLNQKIGAFVTLKEDGQLRGCLGSFSPAELPLYQIVSRMAVAAATQDQRFSPVRSEELVKLRYEISVLSGLEKISGPKQIELGRHGVQVSRGSSSGVFLPQVATENGWSLEQFLGELCSQKAGLESHCWQDKNTAIHVFTAQVFD